MKLKKFFSNIGIFFKKLGRSLAHAFGFNKNSKYVSNYLNDANLRSGAFMAIVIVALEIFVIIRQIHDKIYVKSLSFTFDNFYKYTNGFWLMLGIGLAMTIFCLTYKNMKMSNKKVLIANSVFASVVFAFSFFIIKVFRMFSKSYTWDSMTSILNGSLIIAEYSIAFFLSLTIFGAVLYRLLKGRSSNALIIIVITLFSAICLIFGVKVSYSDFASTPRKDIMCFLTMMVYVGCLLIWRPYISVSILGSLFLGFYILLRTIDPTKAGDVGMGGGDTVNYLTFFVSLTMVCVSIYHQRHRDAIKDEELEYIAHYDDLSGLNNFSHFLTYAKEEMTNQNIKPGEKIFLFVNIDGFKNYNDQRGFQAGNEFLKEVANEIKDIFPNALSCREASDHFILFADFEGYYGKLEQLNTRVQNLDLEIKPGVFAGGYVFNNREEDPRRAVDKARYACSVATSKHVSLFVEYDKEMHKGYHLLQYVIHHIDEAVEKGWIKPYYQPVAWSKTGEICGAEALVRWIDPNKGFLSPGSFVPALEDNKLIHKLDAYIFESVCKDIRKNMDAGLPVVPVSINFSRLDFQLMDAIGFLEGLIKKYNIPKDFIHVEVTESALMEDENLLKKSVSSLKEKGYAVWLDDFGSGYSSLNVLKDYNFDVVKIDMVFLKGFEKNEKSKVLIKSIIELAKLLKMRTLTEGVETKEHVEFLKEAGCERLQGYYFGKPMSYEEFMAKFDSGEFKVAKELN